MDRLPPEIEVEDQWPESLCYRLPRRALASGFWIALVLLASGLLALAWLVCAVGGILLRWKLPIPELLLFPGFAVGFATSGGLTPIWWGLSILFGRREVEIRGDRLRSSECVGFLRWGKSWPARNIVSLRTTSLFPLQEPAPARPSSWNALVLFNNTGQRHTLAWGYSQQLLEPLAAALAANCVRALPEQNRPKIEVSSDYTDAAAIAA
jgi:hypothetical protein